jgi:hypothetical protein
MFNAEVNLSPLIYGSIDVLPQHPESENAQGTECRDTSFDHEEKSPWVDPGQEGSLALVEEPASPAPDGGLGA